MSRRDLAVTSTGTSFSLRPFPSTLEKAVAREPQTLCERLSATLCGRRDRQALQKHLVLHVRTCPSRSRSRGPEGRARNCRPLAAMSLLASLVCGAVAASRGLKSSIKLSLPGRGQIMKSDLGAFDSSSICLDSPPITDWKRLSCSNLTLTFSHWMAFIWSQTRGLSYHFGLTDRFLSDVL